jgi:hypothetical protein
MWIVFIFLVHTHGIDSFSPLGFVFVLLVFLLVWHSLHGGVCFGLGDGDSMLS